MASRDLNERLAALLSRDRVPGEQAIDHYIVDGVRPAAAVLAESVADVSAVLRFASEHGLAVIPRGSGTLIDLGNRPSRYDVALDLTALDAIVDHSPEDLVVTVQAGVRIADLNAALANHGQFLALDPPRADVATVGGALSAGVAGPLRLRYGGARDLVIGLTCVLADGQTVHSGGRVVKNVAGYDMNKLYLGAIGSAGVIVEASFKLHPRPAACAALAARFLSCKAAHAAAIGAINSRYGPASVEIADEAAAATLAGIETGDEQFGWLLAVLLAGLPAAVERQQREIAAMARAAGAERIAQLGAGEADTLFGSLRDFGRAPERPAALILRCAVLPGEISDAVDRLDALAISPAPNVVASPGAGLLRLFWSDVPPLAEGTVRAVRAAVEAMGDTLTVERCPPELKDAIEVWGISGADLDLMRNLKAAFDPAGSLSPGRFVGRL